MLPLPPNLLEMYRLKELLAYIHEMEELVTKFNDVNVMYRVALMTCQGINYCKGITIDGHVRTEQYFDHPKSLYYWQKLESLGYREAQKFITFLEQKVEKEMNNFDILRSLASS